MSTSRSSSLLYTGGSSTSQFKQRRTNRRAVVRPVFIEAAEYTSDNTWKEILINAASDKLPDRFSINADWFLIYRKNTAQGIRYNKVELPQTPKELVEVFITFVKANGQIHSEKDNKCMKKEYEINAREKEKKYKTSNIDIEDYVAKCKVNWELDSAQAQSLKYCLLLGHKVGILQYEIENETIVNVKNIDYDGKTNTFFVDPNSIYIPRNEYGYLPNTYVSPSKLRTKRPKVYTLPDKSKEVNLSEVIDKDMITRSWTLS